MGLQLLQDHASSAPNFGRKTFSLSLRGWISCKSLTLAKLYKLLIRNSMRKLFLLALVLFLAEPLIASAETVRFATYNVSLYGDHAGGVAERIANGNDKQAASEAEIIQRVRPDILLLNEVDYDEQEKLIDTLQHKYLEVGQNVSNSPSGPAEPIFFPYRYLAASNTGIHSGYDLDRNGRVTDEAGSRDYGSDCWGFGQYPGQYGMVVFSKYPIKIDQVRTFKNFLWKDMPDARLPDDSATAEPSDWYSREALEHFPLSSKSHWDVPIDVNGKTIHVLASHPTPPAFDGEEDRNGKRNHDEIRFWVDYIAGKQGDYIYDDKARRGGLAAGESFVIMGDLNGDPHDGQGQEGIARLLASPQIAIYPAPESDGGEEQAKLQGGVNLTHRGNPRLDTLDAADEDGPGNLRLDYVLPSKDLKIVASGVFWPQNKDTFFSLVGVFPFPSSDHHLVWVDVDW
jgi:3-phytase